MPGLEKTTHRLGKSGGVGVEAVLAAHGGPAVQRRRRFRVILLAVTVAGLLAVAKMSGPGAPSTVPGSAGVRGDGPVAATETSSPPRPVPPPPPAAPTVDTPGPEAPSGSSPRVRNTVPGAGAPATADRRPRSPSPVPAPRPSPTNPAPPPAAPPPAPVPADPAPEEEESGGFLDGLRDLLP